MKLKQSIRFAVHYFVTAAAVLLSGCDVHVKTVVGSDLPDHLDSIAGTWTLIENSHTGVARKKSTKYIVQLNDASLGLLTATEIPADSQSGEKPTPNKIYVRKIGERVFLSGRDPLHLLNSFSYVTHWSEKIVVAVQPNLSVVARLIDSGALRGMVTLNDDKKVVSVTLDAISADEMETLIRHNGFNWEQPAVLIR